MVRAAMDSAPVAYFVDDDNLGHVVFHSLDHDGVREVAMGSHLQLRAGRGRWRDEAMSPSPAISLDVSTMTTRFLASTESTAAASRIHGGFTDARAP